MFSKLQVYFPQKVRIVSLYLAFLNSFLTIASLQVDFVSLYQAIVRYNCEKKSLNCEIKKWQLPFNYFYSVVDTGLHNKLIIIK